MKRKELLEYKNKPAAELEKELSLSRDRLRSLRFDLFAGKIKSVREIREVKKIIARTLTFLRLKKDEKA